MAEDKNKNSSQNKELRFINFNEPKPKQREYSNESQPKEGTQEIIRSREDNSHKN